MKNFVRALFCGVSIALFAAPHNAVAEVSVVPLDTATSSVRWVGKKVTGEHSGTVSVKSGEARLQGNTLVGGKFEVDLSSIRVTDVTDPSDNAKLTNHLKSDDFFSVNTHPTATFTIKSATPIANAAAGAPNYNVTGDLSFKGVSHELSFPATITIENGIARAKATFEVDRTKWNVRYGSGKFFASLGDKLIYDNFEIALDVSGKVSKG